jgi:DNA polymerase
MDRPNTARMVRQRLESLARAGVTHLPRSRPSAVPSEPASASPTDDTTAAEAQRGEIHASPEASGTSSSLRTVRGEIPLFAAAERTPALPTEERVRRLADLKEQVARCTRCAALVECRTQAVFGVGSPTARLCFVGEAPGQEEDRQGEPFVGAAGQLLNRILAACKLERDEVYILNVLKCRPPGNRNPLPDEAANCRGFLEQQIEIIRPEFLCALGGVAAQALLETNSSIGNLRGRIHAYRGIPVVCTYHPAYLLRNPSAKRYVWDDMKMLMAELGVPL